MEIKKKGLISFGQYSGTILVTDPDATTAGEWGTDGFELSAAAITGDTLAVTVSYSGGCKEHLFTLVSSSEFLESNPVQVVVVLAHNANGDTCEAWITQDYLFNLTPLKVRYQEAYQQDSPPYYFFATPIEWVIGTRSAVPAAKRTATWQGNRITPLEIPLLSTGLNGVHPRPQGRSALLSQANAAGLTQERQAGFEAGRPLTVGFLLGELTLGALGTISYVEGNRVYGFGHPMDRSGPVDFHPQGRRFIPTRGSIPGDRSRRRTVAARRGCICD